VQAALGRKALLENASIQSAIEHLTRAIQLGFAAPTGYQDLATALVRVGREADAVSTLQRGIELSPYTQALYKLLALSYINLKQYPEAKKTLELYVSLFPEDDFMRGLLLKVQRTRALGGR
jgi:tetratricopeptide (TPR) repeat protein